MRHKDLPKNDYLWVIDSQEIECVLAYLGINHAATLITAALVAVGDGDYEAVYLSEGGDFKNSANWDWQPASFYTDHIPEELDLQGDDSVNDCKTLEAIEYVDLFLDDLEADEPTIDQPADLLNHIRNVLVATLPPHVQDTI